MNNNTVNRNNSIDNIRLLAIFGIIVMHCFPFFFTSFTGSKSLAIAINQLTRFGVPCFFTLSGFLYTKRVASIGAPAALKKTASRLIMLYFVWCIFYILPYNIMLISEKAPLGKFSARRLQEPFVVSTGIAVRHHHLYAIYRLQKKCRHAGNDGVDFCRRTTVRTVPEYYS